MLCICVHEDCQAFIGNNASSQSVGSSVGDELQYQVGNIKWADYGNEHVFFQWGKSLSIIFDKVSVSVWIGILAQPS